MGMFDDLVPNKAALLDQGQPPRPRGLFDDLIPAQEPSDTYLPGDDPALIPKPGSPAAPQPTARTGDALRPYFGGHNPIAETVDLVKPALDPRSDRSLLERAKDTINFAASVPSRMFRLPTPGEMIETATGSDSLTRSEQRFVANNPDLLRAMQAAGEVAAGGGPMGQGFRAPQPPVLPSKRIIDNAVQASDDVARSRAMAEDMRALNIEPFAPIVGSARRGDNSHGAITQALADKPFVGTPIQRGARRYADEAAASLDDIRGAYGSSQTMQGAGSQVRGALERSKDGRTIDVATLTPEQLDALANSPPRLSTVKDVQAAKYQRAENFLPQEKAKAQPVKAGEERVIGGLENTRAILTDIKRRFGLTINKSEAARAKRGAKAGDADALSLESTPDFANPKWTGSANIDRSLDAIAGSKGNWRTGLEGLREIRSNIRRALAAKPDSEVNALSRGDLKRLYSAVSRDMDGLLTRLERQAAEGGNAELAGRYRAARDAYADADAFTARYAGRLDDVRDLLNIRSDEGIAGALLTAMKDGTRGNLQRLISLRRLVPRETIDEMASAVIVELGRPTGRASTATQEAGVSLSKFASQWNDLNEGAKRVMFGHRPELYESLERFARVANAGKDFEALANSSRTGVSNAVMGALGGIGLGAVSPQALAGVVASMTAGRAASSFLSSPIYVDWLTGAYRASTPGAARTQLQRLRDLVGKDGNLPPQEAQAVLLAIREAEDQIGEGR